MKAIEVITHICKHPGKSVVINDLSEMNALDAIHYIVQNLRNTELGIEADPYVILIYRNPTWLLPVLIPHGLNEIVDWFYSNPLAVDIANRAYIDRNYPGLTEEQKHIFGQMLGYPKMTSILKTQLCRYLAGVSKQQLILNKTAPGDGNPPE